MHLAFMLQMNLTAPETAGYLNDDTKKFLIPRLDRPRLLEGIQKESKVGLFGQAGQ